MGIQAFWAEEGIVLAVKAENGACRRTARLKSDVL